MTEHDHQVALFNWALFNEGRIPALKLLFAIPNGGHRHKRVAARMKAEGVKAGVPDICLPVARSTYHGLFIELKVGKNRPTSRQAAWLKTLSAQGYHAVVCYGYEEAKDTIVKYLEQPITEVR